MFIVFPTGCVGLLLGWFGLLRVALGCLWLFHVLCFGLRCLVGLLVGSVVGWLVGWLVGWFAGWLACWLAGWMADWLAG